MNLFWLEYLHFIVAIIAILVSVSSATLFFMTYRSESQLTTAWRGIGFASLAVAFFLFILERKFPGISTIALVVELFGFYGIFRGMAADLSLEKLREVGRVRSKKNPTPSEKEKQRQKRSWTWTLIIIILFAIAFVILYLFARDYLNSALVALSLIFIIGSIRLQIRRLRAEISNKKARRQNMWPLIGYFFFLYGTIALVLYRLPDLNIVILRQLKLEYSLAWQIGLWFMLFGFIFLGVWAWTYIRIRMFLRTYVVFLAIGVVVSSLGALVFTQLIFNTVEDNNLKLMEQGSQSVQTLAADRLDTALFVARTLASNPDLIARTKQGNTEELNVLTEDQLFNTGIDVLRIYNPNGEVIASPNDIRDERRLFNDDPFVAYVVIEESQVKSFSVMPGVLSPVMAARAFYPILDGEELIGVIETAYRFDNPFVDYAQEETGFDVTVYTQDERSATTITTLDGVSRWVGSREVDPLVLERVLTNGEGYTTPVERLGVPYYSGYSPIRDINGQIVGMLSVGTPTVILFEDTRQQLITTFLIVTLISLITAGVGYYAIRSFRKASP